MQRKPCQIFKEVFTCGEVLARTGVEFPVSGKICEKCSPEIIERMCEAARRRQQQKKRTGCCARGVRKIKNIVIGWLFLLLRFNNQEIQNRITICRRCEKKLWPFNFCWICGCYIPAKARVFRERCPLGKWENEDRD